MNVGSAFGFATSQAGAALAGADELQYDHEKTKKIISSNEWEQLK